MEEPVRPMLATAADPRAGLPRDPRTWVYEVKWDGIRALVRVRDGAVALATRRGNAITAAFPELRVRPGHPDALLDGEIVVLRDGVPSFAAVVERMQVREPVRAAALAASAPATLVVFDALEIDGEDLTPLPWRDRRARLDALDVPGAGWIASPVYDDVDGLLAATRAQGLEGVVAKRRASRYLTATRSPDWVKQAHRRTETVLVGGWRLEAGDTRRVGALLLGEPTAGGGLAFCGRVGSGLAGAAVQGLLQPALHSLARAGSPFTTEVPAADVRGTHWVEPVLAVEVRHLGHSEGGRLRQPVFLGVRPDVAPEDLAGGPGVGP